jgi:hypothetical protein
MTPDEARDCLARGGRQTTEDEVARFLEEYKAGIPVMPVTFFCEFLEKWAELYGVPQKEERNEGENKHRAEFVERVRDVFLQIRKSNLLWRTIYRGEAPRTEPCPIHKGRWSGCNIPEETPCRGACMSGNNVTGWLPLVKKE